MMPLTTIKATPRSAFEICGVAASAQNVNDGGIPQIPMLMYISDGSGSGFDKETWRKFQTEYIAQVSGGKYVELDCPHYVHDYKYETISKGIVEFLSENEIN